MGSPSSTLATLRPELGGSFAEYDLAMSRAGFIGQQVMPVMEVGSQAATFGKITIESLLRSLPTERAPGSGYNRDAWEFTTDSYAALEHGFEGVVDDREAKMYRDYFDAEMITAERTRDVVLRNQEIRIAALMQNSSTHTPTNVSVEWSTIATATPVTDVEARVQSLYNAGVIANAMVISWQVFRNLRRCTQVIDLLKSEGAGMSVEPNKIGIEHLRQVFALPYIFVGGGQKNTAKAGQTAAISGVWSNEYCSILRVPETNDIKEPCFGRTFHWGEDGSTIGTAFESYRDETRRGQVVRSRMDCVEKVLYTEALQLLANITA